jgi:exopolysaccharide production protein ExoQ
MATTVAPATTMRDAPPRSMTHLVLGWVLTLPLIFYAVHGTFSFQGHTNNPGGPGSLSGLAEPGHDRGFLGSVAIPGTAYLIVLWLILMNAKRIVSQALQMKMITLLALLTICSALWSQDPFRSLYNGFFYFIDTLFAFYLVVKFDPEEIQSLLMMGGGSVSVLCLIMVIFFPQYGVLHSSHGAAWHGLFGDRTQAAKCFVFLLSPAIIFRRKSFGYRHLIYIALMSLMIFMAYAMTARLVLLVYIALMASISVSSKFGRRSSLVVLGMFLAALALFVCIALPFFPQLLAGMGKNASLTGRIPIWIALLRSIEKRPLLGYGFYAFWQGLKGESANAIVAVHWVFGYAHNGILEICLQLGLVGLAIFFVTLFQAVRNAWYCLRNGCPPGIEWYIGLIALTIMYNVDESTVVWPIELLSILYLVACCGLAKAARQLREIKTIEAMYN